MLQPELNVLRNGVHESGEELGNQREYETLGVER